MTIHKSSKRKILFFIPLMAAICALFYFRHHTSHELQSVETLYEEGEKAQTLEQRRAFFNEALAGYLSLERTSHPHMGDGKLYYNIANTYFQLGEYPLSIYYYQLARKLRPRDERITANLATAEKSLGVPSREQEAPFRHLFFFYSYFSTPERLQIFSLATLIAFFALSVQIWKPQRFARRLAAGSVCVASVFLGTLLYSYYVAPIDAIVLKSSDLYKGAGSYYARVLDKPLPSGVAIEVLESLENGQWVKVTTSDGTLGYLPSEVIKVIP